MADEKLTLEFDVKGVSKVTGLYNSVASAMGNLGSPSSLFGAAQAAAGFGSLAPESAALAGRFVLAGAAILAMTAAVKTSIEALHAFGSLMNQTGGTAAETAQLQLLGSALGIGDIGGMAHAVRQNSTRGLGAGAAASMGLNIQPYDIGSAMDEAANFLKLVEGIRQLVRRGRASEALANLRNLGASPDLLDVGFLSDSQMSRFRQLQEQRSRAFTPEARGQGFMLRAESSNLSLQFQALMVQIGTALLPVIRFLAAGIGQVASFIRQLIPIQRAIAQRLGANTDALNQLNGSIRDTFGIHGGGARARGAVPRAFQGAGQYFGNAATREALHFGAYALSL